MAELAVRERLQPSLLDRLTDEAPEQRRESAEAQTLSMVQLRRAVLRDLAWLLNTTNLTATYDIDPKSLAARSTLNFGVPGFTGLVSGAGRLKDLASALADAIRAFEPRIRPESLVVRPRAAKGDSPLSAMVFEIEGELWAQPVPVPLFLETSIELETRLAIVTDARPRG
jgi:type VI secretion system protein ImpF